MFTVQQTFYRRTKSLESLFNFGVPPSRFQPALQRVAEEMETLSSQLVYIKPEQQHQNSSICFCYAETWGTCQNMCIDSLVMK